MYNEVLIMIEDLCLTIANKSLVQLGMVSPNRSMRNLFNREIQGEQAYDCNELNVFVQENVPKLNNEQKQVYDMIIDAVNDGRGGMYFLDAPGGTRKTFLVSLVLATIRSQSKIALALASPGIAATLLDGGRTAHLALKLSLNMQVNENPTCNITKIRNGKSFTTMCNNHLGRMSNGPQKIIRSIGQNNERSTWKSTISGWYIDIINRGLQTNSANNSKIYCCR